MHTVPKLKFDKAMLVQVAEKAAIGIVVVDTSERIYYCNEAAAAFLGYEHAELMPLTMTDIVHPDELHLMRAKRDAHSKNGTIGSYSREARYMKKNGEGIWVIAHVADFGVHANGRNLALIHFSSIETHKELEMKLRASEQRSENALQSAEQGVWDFDLERDTIYYSAQWKKMRGIPADELVELDDQEWIEGIHPDDRERVVDYVGRQNAGELDRISYEFRVRHREGHWIWILSRGRPLSHDENGVPTRVVGTDTDITSLKMADERLAQLSQRLELAVSISKIGVWEYDVATKVCHWDAVMMDIFGLDRQAGLISDHEWNSVIHEEDILGVYQEMGRALAENEELSWEFRIVLPNNEVRHIRANAKCFSDEYGAVKLVGVNWDATSDINKAEALREANELATQRLEELAAAKAVVEHNSLHDALTNMPNRRYLDERLAKEAVLAAASGKKIALLQMDLDRFKQINDTLGHAAGDAVLIRVAKILQANVREGDFVARIGGDEFVVLLVSNDTPEQLAKLATRIIENVSEPYTYLTHVCRVGMSAGIAIGSGPELDPEQLMVNADTALYRAKSEGRGRYAFFTDALQAQNVQSKEMADQILTGLERDEFFAVFQPQLDVKTLEIAGVEALVRWRHPEKGVLAPAAFLKIAEELNAVAAIDRLVLEQALGCREKWLEMGLYVPRMSVNVSARRLGDNDLIPSLQKLDIKPGTVSFELLESIFLDDQDDVETWRVDQIRELGIEIDIDDFGTGHASIVGLLKINPHRLKIAGQLIAPIVESKTQRQLVKSMIEMGRALNVQVVAEGVETMAHADVLAELGCDIMQGYAFGRPMSAQDLFTYASTQAWRSVS